MQRYVNGTAAYNYGSALPYREPETKPQIREIPAKKTKDNLRLAKKLMCLYLVLAFSLAGAMVYTKVLVMQAETRVENLREEVAALIEENNVKRIQIEQNIDLKRIEEIAISQYGMQRPDKNQIVYLNVEQDDYVEIIR